MKITIEMEMPKNCGVCKFYKETPYRCHNETGYQANCSMGYMEHRDMRDKRFNDKVFDGCRLNEQ